VFLSSAAITADDNDCSLSSRSDDDMSDEDSSDNNATSALGSDDEEEDESLGAQVLQAWERRAKPIESDFAYTAWALCIMPEVMEDVDARMTGCHRDAIERVIPKLYAHDVDADISTITDKFWDEFRDFTTKTGPFSSMNRWNVPDVDNGKSYLWHQKYSLHHTGVLGFVACRTTLKILGIGAAERSWGDVKTLKSNKGSHLSNLKIEKHSIIYTSARLAEARLERIEKEKIDAGNSGMWGDDDINFYLGLDKFGVVVDSLKDAGQPKRKVNC
jgi:hypothetical protein